MRLTDDRLKELRGKLAGSYDVGGRVVDDALEALDELIERRAAPDKDGWDINAVWDAIGAHCDAAADAATDNPAGYAALLASQKAARDEQWRAALGGKI